MKKVSKKVFLGLIVVIAMFMLAGCITIKIDDDYPKMYKEFFDYSLGEWKVVNSGKGRYETKTGLDPSYEYKTWEIAYKNNGEERKLYMKNFNTILSSLEVHLSEIYEEKLLKVMPDLPSPLLINAALDDPIDYKKYPDKLYENYKDIYNFQDVTLTNVYDKWVFYLSITYDLRDDTTLTEEEKLQLIEEKEKEIISLIPKVNLRVKLLWKSNEKYENIEHYYIDGKRVYPEDQEGYEEIKESGELFRIYQQMLTSRISTMKK